MGKRVLHDRFFKQAKREGYLARSAYKLAEIDERFRIIRPGSRVLDLGCAPGSWLQVLAERVGAGGSVVGIDLSEVRDTIGANVRTVQGDFTSADPAELTGGEPFDAVVSDMAPNTSGHGDDLRSVSLCREILDRLPALLRPGGALVMKVLEGGEYPALVKQTAALFAKAQGFKPKASRDVSREIFVVAKAYRGVNGRDARPTGEDGA